MTSPTTRVFDLARDFRDRLFYARQDLCHGLRDLTYTRPAIFIRGLLQHQENRALLQKFGRAMFENLCRELGLPRSQFFYTVLAASANAIKTQDDLEGIIWTIKNLSFDTLKTLSHAAPHIKKLINTPADLIRITTIIESINFLLNEMPSKPLRDVHSIDELETAFFLQPEIKAFIRRWGFHRAAKELNFLAPHSRDFKPFYLEALARLSPLAGSSLDAFQALCKSIGNTDIYLIQIIPQLACDIHSLEDLDAFINISSRMRSLCGKKAAPHALSQMIEHPPASRTIKAWEDIGMIWARFYTRSEIIFFGEDPAEQKANKEDRTYVLNLVKRYPTALLQANSKFLADEDIILTAIEGWAEAYEHAADSLKDSLAFQPKSYQANFNVVTYMVDKSNAIGYKVIEHDGDEDYHSVFSNNAPPELKEGYESIVAELQQLGIHSPERFNTKTAAAIIHDRKNISDPDERPIVLFIYPKYDKTHAYNFNQLQDFVEHGYRVLYFEVGNEEDLETVEKDLQAAGLEYQVSVFRLGGHSAISGMSFGAPDPAQKQVKDPSRVFIAAKPNEGIGKILTRFNAFLQQGALIFADGCGAGGGEGIVTNIADSLAVKYPDCLVFASTRSTKLTELRALFDKNDKVYWGEHPMLYVASTRKAADLSPLIAWGSFLTVDKSFHDESHTARASLAS